MQNHISSAYLHQQQGQSFDIRDHTFLSHATRAFIDCIFFMKGLCRERKKIVFNSTVVYVDDMAVVPMTAARIIPS
jgi:hypothetical protein